MPDKADSPITQAIEKVDAICPRLFVPGSDPVSEVHLERCSWSGHRLVREVAKVCAETAGINKQDIEQAKANSADHRHTQGYIAGRQDASRRINAALPLEVKDD